MEEHLREWFCGDESAVHFAAQLWRACHEWDDLEDEGKCDHNSLLQWWAFGKEYHPFFSAHAALLRPSLLTMALSWEAANVLDHEPDHIAQAYMLRAAIYQVWHLMAWIVGGGDHARKVGPAIYRFYGEHETLDQLKEEMGCPAQS
jgi:hypothetical protein